jgi:hypothetical protein
LQHIEQSPQVRPVSFLPAAIHSSALSALSLLSFAVVPTNAD